jgi:protein-tyrosine phosphatase
VRCSEAPRVRRFRSLPVGPAGEPRRPNDFSARESMHRNILIICHANTNRSVIAESLLNKMLSEHGLDGSVSVRSGGVAAYARDSALVSMNAELVLREEGIDAPAKRFATALRTNPHLIAEADLILAMTHQQIGMLRQRFPEAAEKEVYTLKEFAGGCGDIDDPSGEDDEVFAACRDEIKQALEAIVTRLSATA